VFCFFFRKKQEKGGWGGGGGGGGGGGVDKIGRCVGLKNLPTLCADCLEILGASASWRPKGLFRPIQVCKSFNFLSGQENG